jgi:hypothetical protein
LDFPGSTIPYTGEGTKTIIAARKAKVLEQQVPYKASLNETQPEEQFIIGLPLGC